MLAVAAIPFGAVTATWAAGLRVTVGGLLLWAIALGIVPRLGRDARIILGALLAIAGIGVVQWVGLPLAVARLLSPHHAAQRGAAEEILGAASEWIPLTVSRDLTAFAVAAWAAAACALLLGAAAGAQRHRYWLWVGAAASAIFQVLYGLSNWWYEREEILGVAVPGDAQRLRGTFINPDHFSLHLELVLALLPAAVWWLSRELRRRLTTGRAIVALTPLGLLWIFLLGAVALSGSRAGLLALVVAFTVQGLALVGLTRDRVGAGILFGSGAVAAVALIAATGGRGFARFLGTTGAQVEGDLRWSVLRSGWEMFRAYPATGSGLGTFVAAYPEFQPAATADNIWRHAHNAWLEMLTTAGAVGFVILVVGVAAACWRSIAVIRHGVRTRHRAVGVAALGVLITLVVHESVEFGLTMPANATLAAALVGMAFGCPTRRRQDLRVVAEPSGRQTLPTRE